MYTGCIIYVVDNVSLNIDDSYIQSQPQILWAQTSYANACLIDLLDYMLNISRSTDPTWWSSRTFPNQVLPPHLLPSQRKVPLFVVAQSWMLELLLIDWACLSLYISRYLLTHKEPGSLFPQPTWPGQQPQASASLFDQIVSLTIVKRILLQALTNRITPIVKTLKTP